MGFIAAYKHLDKLCGEVLNDRRGVTAYIEEMERTPRGASCAQGWAGDYKQLKHYRWVRNQIAHDPACDEDNMCVPEDGAWLECFYNRIMEQTDPLSLYRKATTPKPKIKPTPQPTPKPILQQPVYTSNYTPKTKSRSSNWIGYVALFVMIAAIFALLVICTQM